MKKLLLTLSLALGAGTVLACPAGGKDMEARMSGDARVATADVKQWAQPRAETPRAEAARDHHKDGKAVVAEPKKATGS
jgi:hypothetical protein